MKSTRRLDWLIGLLGGIGLLGVAATVALAFEIGKPFGGYKVAYSITANQWGIDALTPPWWPARMRADLQPFTFTQFLDIKLPELITGFGFWLIAIAVYRARPQADLNRVFALTCGLVAGGQLLTVHTLFADTDWPARSLTFVWALIIPWIGVGIVHFAALFPIPIASRGGWGVRGLYALSLLISMAYASALLLIWIGGWSPLAGFLGGVGWHGAHGLFLIGVLYYLIRFAWLLARPDSSPRIRRQLFLVLGGAALAGPYIATTLLHGLTTLPDSHFWWALDVRYLLLAAPLAFAFAVLRYQTFQSRDPLLMGVALLAGGAIAASLGAWLIFWLYPAVGGPPFLPVLVVTCAASVFWTLQNSRQGWLNRLAHWEQNNYQAVHRFGYTIISQPVYEQPALAKVLAAALVSELELERAAVWVWPAPAGRLTLQGQSGHWPVEPPTQLAATESDFSFDHLRLLNEEVEPLPHWAQPLALTGLELVSPLWAAGNLMGLLGLGKRWDEEIFDERGLEVVGLIAQQAGLFLLTAQHIEELNRVPRQVAEAQERERGKIARELHDHTEQFLASLSLNLAVGQKAIARHPEQTTQLLQQCLADVEVAARTLRQIRHNLAPRQLENGLALPLKTLLERFWAQSQVEAQLTLDPELNDLLSLDGRHAIYRVVQQALDNVAEHAGARSVTVTLARVAARAEFSVRDDGCGFSDSRRARARGEDCFGLVSMQDRIALLGGELAITSAPGQGTRVAGWLPIQLEAT